MSDFNQAYIDSKGIVRWKSNDRVPFADKLREFCQAGHIDFWTNVIPSNEQREIEAVESIKAYQKQMENYEYSDEEMFEMRAAFGEGTVVVNIFTGNKVRV